MAEGPSLVEKRQIKTNLRLPVFGNEQKKKKNKKKRQIQQQLQEQAKSSRNLRIFCATFFFHLSPSLSLVGSVHWTKLMKCRGVLSASLTAPWAWVRRGRFPINSELILSHPPQGAATIFLGGRGVARLKALMFVDVYVRELTYLSGTC